MIVVVVIWSEGWTVVSRRDREIDGRSDDIFETATVQGFLFDLLIFIEPSFLVIIKLARDWFRVELIPLQQFPLECFCLFFLEYSGPEYIPGCLANLRTADLWKKKKKGEFLFFFFQFFINES
jgi:hypothetical protein